MQANAQRAEIKRASRKLEVSTSAFKVAMDVLQQAGKPGPPHLLHKKAEDALNVYEDDRAGSSFYGYLSENFFRALWLVSF